MNYRHDRSLPAEEGVTRLFNFIEEFSSREELVPWYHWFEKTFDLPEHVVRHYYKKRLSEDFDFTNTLRFKNIYSLKRIPNGIAKFIGFLAIVFIRKKWKRQSSLAVDLILDHIEWSDALERFGGLIDSFGEKNVVAIVPGKQKVKFKNVLVINKPRFSGYRIALVEFWTMLRGMFFFLLISFRVRTNLMVVSAHMLNSLFYYRTLFEDIKGQHCLIYQHYRTNAIKNYLFKKQGGVCSAAIQKNIHQFGHNGFYYDTDVFFVLGEKAADPAIQLGGRLGQIVPVGSFFMEPSSYQFNESPKCNWDIVNFGGNAFYPGSYCDIYDTHNQDYQEHFLWLKMLLEESPNLRIGIKHHSNYRYRHKEKELMESYGLVVIDEKENSYSIATRSLLAVSWASTMIVEIFAYGKPAFFLDPYGRNGQFHGSRSPTTPISFQKYDEFRKSTLDIIESGYTAKPAKALCYRSDNVSHAIWKYLIRKQRQNEKI